MAIGAVRQAVTWANADPYIHVAMWRYYHRPPNIVYHSDVVGAAPTASSFSTEHLASVDWAKTTAKRDQKYLRFGIWCALY